MRNEGAAVLGEQFLGYLGMVRNGLAYEHPGTPFVVVHERGELDIEVAALFAEYFNRPYHDRPFRQAMFLLADDFRRWVKEHPDEAAAFQCRIDEQQRVVVICQPLPPELSPLSPLDDSPTSASNDSEP